jgi:hypothetical protein
MVASYNQNWSNSELVTKSTFGCNCVAKFLSGENLWRCTLTSSMLIGAIFPQVGGRGSCGLAVAPVAL